MSKEMCSSFKFCWVLSVVFLSTVFLQAEEPKKTDKKRSIPYYFVAIHNEPFHYPAGEKMLKESYAVLRKMVAAADKYNIKLTLMFTAQYADYISSDKKRMSELKEWEKRGHEIAAHHHSIYHGNWDGYTNYSKEKAMEERKRRLRTARRGLQRKPEKYLGTLKDYIKRLKRINPKVKSGCMNEEADKNCMPDEIIYATCSGFANFGKPGRRLSDTVAEKGKNEFVTVGKVNGIERKWLCHFQTTTPDRVSSAKKVFESMSSGVYGSVNHSSTRELGSFLLWLEFLHSKDPEGKFSRTVTEIIEQRLLPEKEIPQKLLTERPDTSIREEIPKAVKRLKALLREKEAEGVDVSEAVELDRESRKAFRKGDYKKCLELLNRAIKLLEEKDSGEK